MYKYNLVNNRIDSKKLSCNFHFASFYLVNSFSGKVNVSLALLINLLLFHIKLLSFQHQKENESIKTIKTT